MAGKGIILGLVGVVVVALAVGCGGDDESGSGGGGTGTGSSAGQFLGSCDTRVMGDSLVLGQCREWHGSPGADLETSCGGIGGVFSDTDACPAAGRVFSCELDPNLGITATYFYYDSEWTAADAEGHCNSLKSN
jgi:hypothetical protein